MSYSLKPINKNLPPFKVGAFSWNWMLSDIIGKAIGYGRGFDSKTLSCSERKDGKFFCESSGARIYAQEAKDMAYLAKINAEFFLAFNKDWNELSEAEQETYKQSSCGQKPIRPDFVQKLLDFSEWAQKSGGFREF